jgi:hypothetical protein
VNCGSWVLHTVIVHHQGRKALDQTNLTAAMLALFTSILLSFRLFFTSGMRGARLNQATKAMKKEKVCYEI